MRTWEDKRKERALLMRKIAIILCCVLYVICPIDLLPDFIPVLGQCDDVGAIVLAIKSLLN